MFNAPTDLSNVLTNAPRECWLAIDETGTKILAKGETVQQALDAAKAAGYEDPLLIWSPDEAIFRVLHDCGGLIETKKIVHVDQFGRSSSRHWNQEGMGACRVGAFRSQASKNPQIPCRVRFRFSRLPLQGRLG